VATVVVPFRLGGKSRLPDALRVDLALAMLGDVLEAAVTHDGDVCLVTDDAAAAAAARASGARVLLDPGGGQGAAVEAALLGAEGACLVVNADLPCVTAAAVARLEELAPAHVPAPDGTTNALALPDRTWFRPAYGAGSAARFAAGGLGPATIRELQHDVDTLDDLEQLERLSLPLGRRTNHVLNEHKALAAQIA
jgi:2-phospho-L-lactate guanylyltransferase